MLRRSFCLVSASILACAAPLSRGERDRAMSHLHATRKMFLDTIAGLSPAQWRFKPDAGSWSISECAEHIAVSEDSLFELITKKIMAGPATPEKKGDTESKDARVLKVIADRSEKAQAPEFLQPSGRWNSQNELVEHFKQSRDRTIAYVRDTQEDLRSHFLPMPAVGEIDAYQWLLLIAAHTERHVLQIKEVMAHPKFPK